MNEMTDLALLRVVFTLSKFKLKLTIDKLMQFAHNNQVTLEEYSIPHKTKQSHEREHYWCWICNTCGVSENTGASYSPTYSHSIQKIPYLFPFHPKKSRKYRSFLSFTFPMSLPKGMGPQLKILLFKSFMLVMTQAKQ